MIQHAVWPTPAPPVTTALWDQGSWQRFEDRYRPADYTGGRYDQEAREEYRKAARRAADEKIRLHWHGAIARHQGQEAADRWLEENRRANGVSRGGSAP
jgi:hypothetical protein